MAVRDDYIAVSPTNSGTFARSSTGYYWNGTAIVSAASGEERYQSKMEFFYTEGSGTQAITWTDVPKGLLLEPQRTNLIQNLEGQWWDAATRGSAPISTEITALCSTMELRKFTDSTLTGSHNIRTGTAQAAHASQHNCFGAFVYPGSQACAVSMRNNFGISDNCTVVLDVSGGNLRIVDVPTEYVCAGAIKYGDTGWYYVWGTVDNGSDVSGTLGVYNAQNDGTLSYTGTDDYFYFQGMQLEDGTFPTSVIVTASGLTGTRNADSNPYSYSTALGSGGKTFGLYYTPFYPKNGNTVLQSDGAAAGTEYDVSIDYETDGDVVGSTTDPGTPTTVTLTHAYASGDEYKKTYQQLDIKGSGGDAKTHFYSDHAEVGTAATHSITDTDALDGTNLILNGFGGIVHRVAFDDASDISGNYSYLVKGISGRRDDYTAASPTNSGTLARSSAGYYWDGTNLTSATTNTERWDEEIEVWYHEGYNASGTATFTTIPKGMLMEPQSTNLVPDSNNLTGGSGTTNTISTGTFVSSNDQIKYTPNNVSSSQFRVYPDSSTFSNSTVYCASALVNPNDIPCLGLYYYFANGSTVCRFDFDTLQWSIPNNNKTINFGVIKYGTTGWYRIWVTGISIRTSGIPLYIYHYPDISTSTWTPNGTDFSQIAHIQFELGYFPSSIILTTGSSATRNADSNTHSYATALGAKGKIFAISHTPFYPKNGNTVFGSDQAAGAGEFEVQADYDTSGLLTMRTDDGTTVVDEATTAIDPYTKTAIQIEAKGSDGDQKTYVWQNGTQLGTAATHGVADTDVLDGSQIVIEGFGGIVHKFGIEDSDY